jgi:hypothetical protein
MSSDVLLALGAGEICWACKPDDNGRGDDQQGVEDQEWLDHVDSERREQESDGQVGRGVEENRYGLTSDVRCSCDRQNRPAKRSARNPTMRRAWRLSGSRSGL